MEQIPIKVHVLSLTARVAPPMLPLYCKRGQTIVFFMQYYLTQRHGVTERIELYASVLPCENIQCVAVLSIATRN